MVISTRGAEWDSAADEFGAVIDRQATTIDELRAILAPLLDDPLDGDEGIIHCRFCEQTLGPEWGADGTPGAGRYSPHDDHLFVHKPDCPVLRKDELLGRSGA